MEKIDNELQEFLYMIGYDGTNSEAIFNKEPESDCKTDTLLLL